jgi:DNA-binding IclR family transcriptional regulator
MSRSDDILAVLAERPRDSREIALALGLGGSRAAASNILGTLRRMKARNLVQRGQKTEYGTWIWEPK